MSSEDLALFPATSRFLSRFQDDSQSPPVHRHSKAIHVNYSAANYLPFNSPQSRPKQSYPIHLFNLPHRISVDEHTVPQALHKGGEEIPTFQYDHATMSDPILFAELMKESGQKYGAIKIVMPESFNNMARTNFQVNPDHFQFKTNRILANPKENEILTRLRFYNELIGFHLRLRSEGADISVKSEENASVEKLQKENTPQPKEESTDVKEPKIEEKQKSKLPLFLQKLPMMDKRPLDLFDLFRLVIMRGGYNEVINRKLWAQIGRELGYKGKITSSLSSSLKLSYAKILYPLERCLGARCAEIAGLADCPGDGEPPAKKHKSELLAPLLLGSAKEFRRSVKAKGSKGILLNQPHLIDVKPPSVFSSAVENGSTEGKAPKNSTSCSLTPAAQISSYLKWISTNAANLQDATRHEPNGKSPSVFSLRQFIENDSKFQEVLISSNPSLFGINSEPPVHNLPSHLSGFQISEESNPITPQALEEIYWQRVSHEGVDDVLDGLKIENCFSLPHLANSSGFLRIGDDFSNYKSHLNIANYPSMSFASTDSSRSQDHMSTSSSKSGTPTPSDTPVASSRPSFNGDASATSSHSEALILNCQPYISRTIGNSLAPFNLHNIPTLPNSLLGALSAHDVNNNDMYNSRLNVGMTFSTENWHCEDHFLQRCSYHFFGRSKRWYFIPELDFAKFEELIREVNEGRDEKVNLNSKPESWQVSELLKFLNTDDESLNFEYECLLNSLENMVNPYPEVRAFLNDPEFQKIIDFQKSKRDSIYYNQEYFINPEMLQSRGIRFTTTLQKPGEIILQYPKSYSLSISMGLNITEDVNFASKGWLDYAQEGEDWLKKQGILPNISLFKLLVNIASLYENNCGSFDSDVYTKALQCYDKVLEKELTLRNIVRSRVKMKEIIIEERGVSDSDGIADDNLQNLYPSKVLISNAKDGELFSMSLESFLQYLDELEVQKRQNGQELTFPDFIASSHKIELHLFLSDDRLNNFQKVLSGYSIEFDEWVSNYETIMKDEEEIPFRVYKNLLGDGQKILAALSSAHPRFKRFVSNGSRAAEDVEREQKMRVFKEYVETLDHFVNHCNDIIEECQAVLSLKHQQRIRGASENNVPQEQDKQGKLSTLLDLANKIPKLNFYAVEFDQILEFKNDIQNFDRACRSLISKASVQQSELNDMINLGTSFGIKLPILDFLVRLRDRELWIKTFDILFEGGDPFAGKKDVYSLSHLQQFHEDGVRVLSTKDLTKLQQVDAWFTEGTEYDEKVKSYVSNHKKLNTVNLAELDSLIVDMEDRAKNIKEKRLFVFMESYHKLVDLKAQAPLIKFLQSYRTTSPTLFAAKQMVADLEKSYYDCDDAELKADLEKSYTWLGNLWSVLKRVKVSFGSRSKHQFDTQTLKYAVNTDLVKKLTTVYNKTATNLSNHELDPFERSGGFLYLKDIDPGYDEKHPLRYCICRELEDGIMIECDKCHEWYHIFCVNEKLEIEENDDNYVCPACVVLESNNIPAEFANERISDVLIDEFVAMGETLKIKPTSELEELKRLKEQIDAFKTTFSEKDWANEQTAFLVHYEAFRFRKVFGAPVLITSIYDKLLAFLRTHSNILFTAQPQPDKGKNNVDGEENRVDENENEMDVDEKPPAAVSNGSNQSPKPDVRYTESVTRTPTELREDMSQRRNYLQSPGPLRPPPIPQFDSPLSMAKPIVPVFDFQNSEIKQADPLKETSPDLVQRPTDKSQESTLVVSSDHQNGTLDQHDRDISPVTTSNAPNFAESNELTEPTEAKSESAGEVLKSTDVKPAEEPLQPSAENNETPKEKSPVDENNVMIPKMRPDSPSTDEPKNSSPVGQTEQEMNKTEEPQGGSGPDSDANEPAANVPEPFVFGPTSNVPEQDQNVPEAQSSLEEAHEADSQPIVEQTQSSDQEPKHLPIHEVEELPISKGIDEVDEEHKVEGTDGPYEEHKAEEPVPEQTTVPEQSKVLAEPNAIDSKLENDSVLVLEDAGPSPASGALVSKALPSAAQDPVHSPSSELSETTAVPQTEPIAEPGFKSSGPPAELVIKSSDPADMMALLDMSQKEEPVALSNSLLPSSVAASQLAKLNDRPVQPPIEQPQSPVQSSLLNPKLDTSEAKQQEIDNRPISNPAEDIQKPSAVAPTEPGDETLLASLAAQFPNTSSYPDETYVDQSLPFVSSQLKQEGNQDASIAQSGALGEILLAELGENEETRSEAK